MGSRLPQDNPHVCFRELRTLRPSGRRQQWATATLGELCSFALIDLGRTRLFVWLAQLIGSGSYLCEQIFA